MVVANFTPDKIRWTHGGIVGIIKPGETFKCDEKRGKFLLTHFDTRGLVKLDYGDNEENARIKSMENWTEFWKRQIVNFNQSNEERKAEGKGYVRPQPEVIEHAEKLGIKLIGPWTIQQSSTEKEVQDLKATIASLKAEKETTDSKVDQLVGLVEKLIKSQSKQEPEVKQETETDWDDVINRFFYKGKDHLKPWVEENLAVIVDYPDFVKDKLREKYTKFYEEDLPI